MLLTYLCFAAFAALLGLAAFSDVRKRRIPNRLTAGLALLYPIYVVTSPVPVAWPVAVGLAIVVFVIGFGLFARELIGGGDVKLLAALSLWAGPEQFVWFMLITALAGGALSLFTLWYRRWGLWSRRTSLRSGWRLQPAVRRSYPMRRPAASPISRTPCPTASPSPWAASP